MGPGIVVLEVLGERIAWTAELDHAVRTVTAAGLCPAILTSDRSVLTGPAVDACARSGVRWLVQREDGLLYEATTGVPLPTEPRSTDACRTVAAPCAEHSGHNVLRHAQPGESWAAVGFDLVVHHRAAATLEVGRLAQVVSQLPGMPTLERLGRHEPLTEGWSTGRLTAMARAGMPSSPVLRATSESGGFMVSLRYERSTAGVIERMRGRLVLGPWASAAGEAGPLAVDLLRRWGGEGVPILLTTSLVDVDAAGAQGVRRRRPERPLAWLAGPLAVRRGGLTPRELERRFGAVNVGRPGAPLMLLRFFEDPDPAQRVADLVAAISPEAIRGSWGLETTGDWLGSSPAGASSVTDREDGE